MPMISKRHAREQPADDQRDCRDDRQLLAAVTSAASTGRLGGQHPPAVCEDEPEEASTDEER